MCNINLFILTLISFINPFAEVSASVVHYIKFPATFSDSWILRENIVLEDTLILNLHDKKETNPHVEDNLPFEATKSFWQLDFTDKELSADYYSELFHFEVFVNHDFIKQIRGNSEDVNGILKEYLTELNDTDVLKLILINHEFSSLKIKSQSKSFVTNNQEVNLYFLTGHQSQYEIDLINKPTDIVDIYFFYVEKSNGIENLRDIRDRLDPLIEEQKPFVVYFHGPENKALTISHKSDQNQIDDFFNILFTSRTQPPSVPKDELFNVYNIISQFVSENSQQTDLMLYLYFNEASYSFLLNPFITPLLESRLPQLNLLKWHATILTDFNISNKNEKHTYINIW